MRSVGVFIMSAGAAAFGLAAITSGDWACGIGIVLLAICVEKQNRK